MNHRVLVASLALLTTVILFGCGSAADEPTAVPPTPTPAPSPTPSIFIITESPELDFDAFVEQMPPADVDCLFATLGEERMRGLAAGTTELNEAETDAMESCFSNEFVVGFLAGQVQRELGTFSGSSATCVAALLEDIPEGVLTELVISEGDDPGEGAQQAIQGFTECLTVEEMAALAAANTDEAAADGDGQRYSSPDELCMIDHLGDQFADGFGSSLADGLLVEFSDAASTCGLNISTDGLVAAIEDTERKYVVADLEDVGLKKSKFYDVKDLEGASSVHYGFFGHDPYSRLEYEARFYFSHELAIGVGVEFANEATGAGVSLYEDDQRWKEGLAERRRCDANGGHHVGRCGFPKYYDYVVAGNMVLLCQGKTTLESLEACAALLDELQ